MLNKSVCLFISFLKLNTIKQCYSIKISVATISSLSSRTSSTFIPLQSPLILKGDQNDYLIGNKLELLTGGRPATMKIEVYNRDDKLVCSLDDNTALLGSYPIDDGMKLLIIDSFTMDRAFEDIQNVEKFELSEEKYSQRSDTVKAFMERNKMGRYNEEELKKKEEQRKKEEEEEERKAKSINVGDRCEVSIPGQSVRRGTVMFVGTVRFKPGWWIGVKYDEPLGKNDGSVQGVKYFECAPKYGGFVKPSGVTVGDFPEEELDLDEM